ncbi:transporter [Lithospermum erythrorhizon]|uniref:Transporter n=1 Tax=Lithospermum erythrorhizon TaxID=34254 RepID=A0AAV3P037_LITER
MDMDFLSSNMNSTAMMDSCSSAVTQVANIAIHMVGFMVIVFFCNCLHLLLRRASQSRIISESIVGLTLSNIPLIRKHLNQGFTDTLVYLVDFGMVCHMFVVGLEIDPNMFLHIPLHEAKVSTSSLLSTLIISFLVIPVLQIAKNSKSAFTFGLSVVVAGTNSPLLTRIITDLKIGKSDIGKFVVGAGIHSDVIFTLIISIGLIIFDRANSFEMQSPKKIAEVIIVLLVQFLAGKKLTPFLMNWVNGENPEGKPMKGSHLVLSIAYVIVICGFSPYLTGYDKVLSAFIAGFSMPREGRVSKLMINKGNYFFTAVFYPLFFLYVGAQLDFTLFEAGKIKTWLVMISIYLTGVVGKVIGSAICGVLLGFHWPESVAIGLFLTTKGRFQLYLATAAYGVSCSYSAKNSCFRKYHLTPFFLRFMTSDLQNWTCIGLLHHNYHDVFNKHCTINDSRNYDESHKKESDDNTVIVILVSIASKPLIGAFVIKRARKRSPTERMALQWHNKTSELCLLVCIHGPQNTPSVINLMEISRESAEPGIKIHLTEILELTDKIADSLTYNAGEGNAVTVNDPEVVESREKTSSIVREYLEKAGKGVSVQRMLALAPISTLHQDVCILAEDLKVSLIILPFHMLQDMDGKLVTGNSGFRHVNRKILRQAPCSVGILVDRGLGTTTITKKPDSFNVAVIFIGGKDDREALMFAGRLALHPGVKLTVIRFLLEIGDEDSVTTRISKGKINTSAHQEEMKLDDECFTEFYDGYVAGGKVAYLEKYLVNSGQTFSTLTTLESQYSLFIVGRDGRVNSVLTVGMNDWEQCPELGPIGDILSGSQFSATASVLIIQQHSLKGGLDGLHDEFSVM